MSKKYELTNETTVVDGRVLHRIRVLKDFANVKAGDLGGFVEAEYNLSQFDNCWVSGNALVCGNAKVFGNATVRDNAKVSGNAVVRGYATVRGNAWVYGNAVVCDNAKVNGDAWVFENAIICENAGVYGNAIVYGNAKVFGKAEVSGDARIFDNAKVNKTPFDIRGFKHGITITETHIFIGCEGHTIKHWKKEIWNIGRKHIYTDDEIERIIKILKSFISEDKDEKK